MVKLMKSRLQELFQSFERKKIAVVGDLMIDQYFWGTVRRISPEAPVPVVEVNSESTRLGGAANVANNVLSLGGEPLLVGLIGDDHQGHQLTSILKEEGLSDGGIVVDGSRPTTIKTRVIAHDQHVVRVDSESKNQCSEAMAGRILDSLRKNIQTLDAIILEDYNKGVLSKKVIHDVITLAQEHNVIVTVDPKVFNFLEYKNVTVFKPNRAEVEEAMGTRLATLDDVVRAGTKLRDELDADNVLLTRGDKGMSLFESSGEISHFGNVAKTVHDVSGAGDTVIATMTLALASGATVREAAALANYAAGVVVGFVGIVPIEREQLMTAVLQHDSSETIAARA